MKHKFNNPLIKSVVQALVELDRSYPQDYQTIQEFMEELGVVLDPVSEGNLAREAMKMSLRMSAPTHIRPSKKWGEAPAFRADVLDAVAKRHLST